jgi:hypothetical protein
MNPSIILTSYSYPHRIPPHHLTPIATLQQANLTSLKLFCNYNMLMSIYDNDHLQFMGGYNKILIIHLIYNLSLLIVNKANSS